MTFAELNLTKPLLNALDDLSYTTPSTIQERVFSVVMSGKDVCGIAQTGTGKTLAYLLPALRQLVSTADRQPQVLILVPTRELVVQVVETVEKLAVYMNVAVVGVYGGANMKPQAAGLQRGANVIVATPGRLVDLLNAGAVRTKAIRKLVIDEFDEMLTLGFRTQLATILELLPERRQNLLFSATLTADVEALIDTYFNSPVRVEAAPVGTPLDSITQTAYLVPNFYTKINLLTLLLNHPGDGQPFLMTKVLVFVATKKLADLVFESLETAFADTIGIIHANKEQNKRFDAVNKFKAGTYRILIATDLVSRGLDVAEVSHVINFDLPGRGTDDEPENYIHRIGRTGRADKTGVAISFITEAETEQQTAIEALMNYAIPMLPLPDALVISDRLTPDEMPKIAMKTIEVKIPKREAAGPAFHEKTAKNQKVNVRRDHAAEKMKKYGKPIKRSGKK